ncbi:MAG: hypothetical protein WCW13_04250 [archaeon]|jgi:hypothetical protein
MKGFFAYALCLAMIITLLFFGVSIQKNQFTLEQLKNELIIADTANKERTLLENNTDKIILLKLKEATLLKNFKTDLVQEQINLSLLSYLKGKSKARTIFNEELGEATLSFLNQNSSVTMLTSKEITYAEYTFTSNILKTTTVGTTLGNKIKSYFLIPTGRTTRIIG